MIVEKLSKLSTDLSSSSPSDSNPTSSTTIGGRAPESHSDVENTANPPKYVGNPRTNPTNSVQSLRTQVRDIAKQVAQFEERIKISNLLNEIRGDLRQRVQQIQSVLGENSTDDNLLESAVSSRPSPSPATSEPVTGIGERKRRESHMHMESKMLELSNVVPFWNEQSQVYQLDFNGRVTQESAKNFQIEYQTHQVLQFGRIENGSYTLDFREPFTAIQAFAIALASITQRLK